jgi:hypothetical protein
MSAGNAGGRVGGSYTDFILGTKQRDLSFYKTRRKNEKIIFVVPVGFRRYGLRF